MNMDEALIGECLKDTLDRPVVPFPWSKSKPIEKGDDVDDKDTPFRLSTRQPRTKTKPLNINGLDDSERPKTGSKETSPTITDPQTLGETDTGVALNYACWNGTPKQPSRSQSVPNSSPAVSPRTAAANVDIPTDVLESCDSFSYVDSSVYNISYGTPSRLARSLSRVVTAVNDVYDEVHDHPRVSSPSIPKSARPLSASRPHMTRVTAGLRESKPASRRVVIKDPEEIVRMRRKLLATNKTKPSLNVKSVKLNKESQDIVAKSEDNSKVVSTSKSSHNGKKDKKVTNLPKDVAPKELVLTNIESDDDLLESLDDLKVKSPRKVPKPKTFDDDDIFGESPADRRSFIGDLSDSDDVQTPVYKLEDLIPKANTANLKPKESQESSNTMLEFKEQEKPSKLKSKLDMGKKLIKKLYKSQSSKVVPLEAPYAKPVPKSEEELADIAAMFCVENPAQASLRRYMKGNFLEDDHDGGHFKPGIWDCELADQEDNGGSDSEGEGEIIDDPRPGAVSRRSKRSVRCRRKDLK